MSTDYAPGGMSDQEYEAVITSVIATTCHFAKSENGKFYFCRICGEKLTAAYRELNERMLIHYERMHTSTTSKRRF